MSEFDRAAFLRARLAPPDSKSLLVPNGDDAAVMSLGGPLVVTTDCLVEKKDFDPRWAPWDAVGRKALAINLSDLASMGARPVGYTLSICASGLPDAAWETLAKGLADEGTRFGIGCVTGDLSGTDGPVVIGITALGEMHHKGALRRNGAKAGQGIFVTGSLGGAAHGLRWLLSNGRAAPSLSEALAAVSDDAVRECVRRQLTPVPRVAAGQALVTIAGACIDVSDGLLQDLSHLLVASDVGATLEESAIPKEPGVWIQDALAGGEDFELLFTADNAQTVEQALLGSGVKATRIGTVTSEKTLRMGNVAAAWEDVVKLERGHAPGDPRLAAWQGFVHNV